MNTIKLSIDWAAGVVFCFGLFCFACSTSADEGFLKDPGLETLGQPDSPWKGRGANGYTVETSEVHSGARSAYSGSAQPGHFGLFQVIDFPEPVFCPIRIGGWSKVDPDCPVQVSLLDKADYDLYIDAFYDDGTPLWGQKAVFNPAVSGWQKAEGIICPEKPLKRLEVFVLLRQTPGKVWFDDLFVEPLKLQADPVRLARIGDSVCIAGRFNFLRKYLKDDFRAQLIQNGQTVADLPLTGSTSAFVVDVPRWKTGDSTDSPADSPSDSPADSGSVAKQEAIDPDKPLYLVCQMGGKEILRQEVEQSKEAMGAIVPQTPLVWTVSSMERVFLHSLPKSDATACWSLDLARNEDESFQIAVLSDKPDRNVQIELSDLVNVQNPQVRIPKANLDWKQIGYVKADNLVVHEKDQEGLPGYWPELLLPRKQGELLKNRTVAFWVTVHADDQTKPGDYAGTVRLTTSSGTVREVQLTARVWDFALDSEKQLPTAFALMDGYFEATYKELPSPEVRRRFAEFLIQNRLSPEGDITRTELPNLDSLSAYKGRGLGKFNVINFSAPRGSRPWIPYSAPEFYTSEKRQEFLDMLRPYVEELRKRGLSQNAYIYSFDERGEAYHQIMTDWFGMVKKEFPEIPTFTTAYLGLDLELLNRLNVDWICPVSSSYKRDKADELRAGGKQVWSYICCGPRYPYANIMFRFPLIEARVLGWQAFDEQYDGFLYWHVNNWKYGSGNQPIDPEASLFCDWKTDWRCDRIQIYGDGLLVYPSTEKTPIGCIRLANLRDGLDDYLYLTKRYPNRSDRPEARKTTQPVFCNAVHFTRDARLLLERRQTIAREIEARR